jgi:predicted enzyme related to lactoylglutathione lyase
VSKSVPGRSQPYASGLSRPPRTNGADKALARFND